MRLIYANDVKKRADHYLPNIRNVIANILRHTKTIDAVEVVRCKDCKNWDTTWQNDWAKNYHYCSLIDGTRNGDWYCADAERRTDE